MRRFILPLLLVFTLLLSAGVSQAQTMEALPPAPEEPEPPPLPQGWMTLEGIYMRLHTAPEQERAARKLLEHGESRYPELARQLMTPTGSKLEIYLADSPQRFRDLQPGDTPHWADGTAWPSRGLIFLRAPALRGGTADPLEQVMTHEMIHILVGRIFGQQRAPSWLQEGLAQVWSGEYDPSVVKHLAQGMLGGGLLSLDDLTSGFPADPMRARLAYAQSADLVSFIHHEHGPETMASILHEIARGTPVRAAFRLTTGESPDAIDARWRQRLEHSMVWMQPLSDGSIWWGLAAGIFLLAPFAVRRKNRETLARWEREEALQEALRRSLMEERDTVEWPILKEIS